MRLVDQLNALDQSSKPKQVLAHDASILPHCPRKNSCYNRLVAMVDTFCIYRDRVLTINELATYQKTTIPTTRNHLNKLIMLGIIKGIEEHVTDYMRKPITKTGFKRNSKHKTIYYRLTNIHMDLHKLIAMIPKPESAWLN